MRVAKSVKHTEHSSTLSNGTPPKALVIRTAGTNCDQETIHALGLAGAESELIHVNQLLTGRIRLHPYQILVFPGGFSYGDDISAGKVFGNELRLRLRDQLERFVQSKKLVIGVCNGFQVLVKAGLLPGFQPVDAEQTVTLAMNDSSRFQCAWTGLQTEKSAAQWLALVPKTLELPIAHGEGKFVAINPAIMKQIEKNRQVVFRYAPQNPNGSEGNIAGICNVQGNVIGLMPHPERFVSRFQHPNWPSRPGTNGTEWGDGYWFWKSAVIYAKNLVH